MLQASNVNISLLLGKDKMLIYSKQTDVLLLHVVRMHQANGKKHMLPVWSWGQVPCQQQVCQKTIILCIIYLDSVACAGHLLLNCRTASTLHLLQNSMSF